MKVFQWISYVLPLAAASVAPGPNGKVDYTGFKVVRVPNPGRATRLESQIIDLSAHIFNAGSPEIDVVVAPQDVDKLSRLVSKSTIVNQDVGAALAEEGEFSAYAVPSASWFTAYHSYADHIQFLRDLQGGYTANSALITAGSSVQGRTLQGIQIWGAGGRGSRPAVLLHGTVHAREWISTMTAEYLAYQLLTLYSSNATVKAVVDKFDFYIMTIVNPDGFVYSQTTDRLWRKNRQTVSGNSCVGRDINRNWPYQWSTPGGSSTNPCSETYRGQAAGDAPENRGLVAQVNSLRDSRGIRLYIDIHSYGQYILWPYGYNCAARAENNAQLQSIATTARSAIASVYGTAYTIGPSCQTLYATTGSSVDHIDVVGNSTVSYTYELRDKGTYGFTLPANQIQPTVVETWQGVLSMLQAL